MNRMKYLAQNTSNGIITQHDLVHVEGPFFCACIDDTNMRTNRRAPLRGLPPLPFGLTARAQSSATLPKNNPIFPHTTPDPLVCCQARGRPPTAPPPCGGKEQALCEVVGGCQWKDGKCSIEPWSDVYTLVPKRQCRTIPGRRDLKQVDCALCDSHADPRDKTREPHLCATHIDEKECIKDPMCLWRRGVHYQDDGPAIGSFPVSGGTCALKPDITCEEPESKKYGMHQGRCAELTPEEVRLRHEDNRAIFHSLQSCHQAERELHRAPPPPCRTPGNYFAEQLPTLQFQNNDLREDLDKIQAGCAKHRTKSKCNQAGDCTWDADLLSCSIKNNIVWGSMVPQNPAVQHYDKEVEVARLREQARKCADIDTLEQCSREPRCTWDGQVCTIPTYMETFYKVFKACVNDTDDNYAGIPACVLRTFANRSDIPPIPSPLKEFLQKTAVCLKQKTEEECSNHSTSSKCNWYMKGKSCPRIPGYKAAFGYACRGHDCRTKAHDAATANECEAKCSSTPDCNSFVFKNYLDGQTHCALKTISSFDAPCVHTNEEEDNEHACLYIRDKEKHDEQNLYCLYE